MIKGKSIVLSNCRWTSGFWVDTPARPGLYFIYTAAPSKARAGGLDTSRLLYAGAARDVRAELTDLPGGKSLDHWEAHRNQELGEVEIWARYASAPKSILDEAERQFSHSLATGLDYLDKIEGFNLPLGFNY